MNDYYWANRSRILARAGEAARAEKYVARMPKGLSTWEQEFWWKHVDIDLPTECWLWKGRLSEKGYGRLQVGHKDRRAHQVAWELIHGRPIPEGCCIMHTCDHPACCNPLHLRSGTNADNMADATRKGRRLGTRAGEKHPRARLTRELVARIRAEFDARAHPLWEEKKRLAASFGISPQHVNNILKGRYWKD